MSVLRWRWLLISVWVAVACITFVWVGSMATRSWLLLLVSGIIPPAMLLWLWKEDGPELLGSLRSGAKGL
jgi:hypothetical protein